MMPSVKGCATTSITGIAASYRTERAHTARSHEIVRGGRTFGGHGCSRSTSVHKLMKTSGVSCADTHGRAKAAAVPTA